MRRCSSLMHPSICDTRARMHTHTHACTHTHTHTRKRAYADTHKHTYSYTQTYTYTYTLTHPSPLPLTHAHKKMSIVPTNNGTEFSDNTPTNYIGRLQSGPVTYSKDFVISEYADIGTNRKRISSISYFVHARSLRVRREHAQSSQF